MNQLLRYARFGFYVFALPLAATAAVSAHQYLIENEPIKVDTAAVSAPASPVTGLTGSFRHHTLSINADGNARGRIAVVNSTDKSANGLADIKVFFVRGGKIVHLVKTNARGEFEIKGLEEGLYSFIAASKDGFAAFGVNAIKGAADVAENKMEIAVVNPNFQRIREVFAETSVVVKSTNEAYVSVAGELAQVVGANRVALNDGNVTGRLYNFRTGAITEGTKAILVQDNKKIAETSVDTEGKFSFTSVLPGVYEFASAGPDGYAAVSFEAVEIQEVAAAGSLQQGDSVVEGQVPSVAAPSPELEVPQTNPEDHLIVSEQLNASYDANSPDVISTDPYSGCFVGEEIGCGAAAGGCCGGCESWGGYGGCCGGGGGFGFGGLAGLALLAWAISEIDDNDPNVPPPQSPNS